MILFYFLKAVGGKTIFMNIDQLCADLHRSPKLLLQLISHVLSCRITQHSSGAHMISSSTLTAAKALEIVDQFTAQYLLCPRCSLAETILVWVNASSSSQSKKPTKRSLHLKCDACGSVLPVRDAAAQKKSLLPYIEQNSDLLGIPTLDSADSMYVIPALLCDLVYTNLRVRVVCVWCVRVLKRQ